MRYPHITLALPLSSFAAELNLDVLSTDLADDGIKSASTARPIIVRAFGS